MKYIKSFSSITENVESPIIEKVESFISKPQMETMVKKYQALLANPNNIENRKHLEDSLNKMKLSLEKIDREMNSLKTKIKDATKKIRSFGDKNPTKKDTLKTDILNWKFELKKLEGNRVNESSDSIFFEKDVKNFCNLWGQSDEEVATNLGFDEKDPGFSELMIGHDYIWVEKYNVWVPENNSFYTDEDDEMIQYIKSNQ